MTTPLVPLLLRFARGRGASLPDIARLAPVDLSAIDAEDAIVPSGLVVRLFDVVEDVCGEPWVGLRLAAEPPRAACYAPLLRDLASSRVIGDVLARVANHAVLLSPDGRATWDPDTPDGAASLTYRPSKVTPGRHIEEYALAFALARCREVSRDVPVHVERVAFTHARPRDVLPLQRYFGTTALAFGEDEARFWVSPRMVATALPGPSAPLTDASPPRTSTAALVARALPPLLPRGATLDLVARSLALSERTLQRRLEEEGTTFLAIHDEVREAEARSLLNDATLTLLDVGERLGFADLATFSRAFKRWTGHPPGMFRRKRFE